MSEPKVGDMIRWAKPGPVVLVIELVRARAEAYGGWWVQAGGFQMVARHEPEDGVEWVRHPIW